MNSLSSKPDEVRLRGLLDGTLSEAEQAEVLALVESNPQWQQALDRLAAGAQTWEAAAQHLHQPPHFAGAALRSAIAAVQPPTVASDQAPVEPRANLDFLTPVDDARYLGRFGEYLIERVIGRGGFGIVLQAFDPPLRRIVALKVLAPHLSSNAAACLRFSREAKAAAAVVHDHVITIHSVGDKPLPHLVMQFVAGHSLQEKLDKSGPLEVKEVLRIGMQTAAGLAAAHKHGQVHRDIKPANILMENGVERVKITDFGLARAADDASMTQSGVVAGTPQYMSPEQARGDTVDARSDLFSLGSVLYAMCAGHPPFRATTTMGVLKRVCDDPPRPIREVNPEIPQWLAAIIERLMAKRPEDRFGSAQEVADLLGQCLSHVQQPGTAPLPQPAAGTLAMPSPAAPEPSPRANHGTQSVPPTDEALLERARRAVREPAIGLVIAGILNWVALAIVFAFLPGLFQDMMRNDTYRWLPPVIAVLGLGSGLIVLGGLKMMRLENRFLVTLAAIAAMFIGPGYFVGFAMGLWALVVLQRREVKEAFEKVRRRHWPGLADAPAELPCEGEWSCRCLTCGYIAPLHKWGGVRIGAASRGKRSVLWCPFCRWLRWMSIERFSAKDEQLRQKVALAAAPPPTAPLPRPSGASLVLLVLFLVIAVPLTLAFAVLAGYFLMGESSPPQKFSAAVDTPEATGALIYQNPDSRFEVFMHRVKTPDGEHVVSSPFGPGLRHNQFLRVPPGEYRAEVRSGGMVIREDTFHVSAGRSPTTYSVGAGGTLRFVGNPEDRSLVLVLNHVTGQTIWNWPQRQVFVLPEGLVHIDLRRPNGSGAYPILTSNYFDIVAGQETVIRIREKDIELRTLPSAFDAKIAIHRHNLETVQTRYAAGQTTQLEVIDAQLKLELARLDAAEKMDRDALALSIREQIVALAQERERLTESNYELGRITLETLNEARLAVLTQKEQLRQAVAGLKQQGQLPSDYRLPPHLEEILLARFDPSKEKPVLPPSSSAESVVQVEDGAWRIVNDTGMGNFRVRLATLRSGVPEEGVLICRAKVKLTPTDERAWGELELRDASPDFFEYDWPEDRASYRGAISEWKPLEVRYPAHLFVRKDPPEVPISVGLHANGTLWVKDLELSHLPGQSETRFRREAEKVVRSFTFKDRPITQDTLFDSVHGWRYSVVETKTVRLFEIQDPQVETGRLIFRCRMKSKDAAGASLSLRIRYPDGVEVRQVEEEPDTAQGTTDWATYAVSRALRTEIRPERVTLAVEMKGASSQTPRPENYVWIKDVELLVETAPPGD